MWRDLLRKTGDGTLAETATTYELTSDTAMFYEAVPGGPPRVSVVEWALANDFVQEVDGFEVRWQQDGDHHTVPFFERDRAEHFSSLDRSVQ